MLVRADQSDPELVSVTAAKLAKNRFLLPEDVVRYITEAIRSDIGK